MMGNSVLKHLKSSGQVSCSVVFECRVLGACISIDAMKHKSYMCMLIVCVQLHLFSKNTEAQSTCFAGTCIYRVYPQNYIHMQVYQSPTAIYLRFVSVNSLSKLLFGPGRNHATTTS